MDLGDHWEKISLPVDAVVEQISYFGFSSKIPCIGISAKQAYNLNLDASRIKSFSVRAFFDNNSSTAPDDYFFGLLRVRAYSYDIFGELDKKSLSKDSVIVLVYNNWGYGSTIRHNGITISEKLTHSFSGRRLKLEDRLLLAKA